MFGLKFFFYESFWIFLFLGTFEELFTPYHYFIGCRNDIINNDDKLNEVAALQQGVEVKNYLTRFLGCKF